MSERSDDSAINIGERIKLSRSHLNMTQQQLGDKIGANKASVSQWENGVYIPDAKNLSELAKALGVSVFWLMDGEGEPAGQNVESVGSRIKRLRKALGLTQTKLANILGIKAPSVVQWEGDKTSLSDENLLNTARILGVTPDYLLYGDLRVEQSIPITSPTPAAIGSTIRSLRKQRNMTINDLAIAINSDVGNISRLERNMQGYSPQLLTKISEALEINVADLFSNPHLSDGIDGSSWQKLAKARMKEIGLSQEGIAEKLRAYPNRLLFHTMMPHAKCSIAS